MKITIYGWSSSRARTDLRFMTVGDAGLQLLNPLQLGARQSARVGWRALGGWITRFRVP